MSVHFHQNLNSHMLYRRYQYFYHGSYRHDSYHLYVFEFHFQRMQDNLLYYPKIKFWAIFSFFKIFENSIWTQKCLLWLFGISPLVTLTWSGHGWPWLLTSYLEKHYHSFRHINKKKNENKCTPNKDALFKLFLTSFWLIFDPKLGHFIPKKLQ